MNPASEYIRGYCSVASICTWEHAAKENSKATPKITNRKKNPSPSVRLIQPSLVEFCRLHAYLFIKFTVTRFIEIDNDA